jgi:hypothetical protein
MMRAALVVLAFLLALLLTAASWPSPGAAERACATWVKARLGLTVTSVTCQLDHEHALCLARTQVPSILIVDCLQEHIPDHYRCVLYTAF